MSFINSKTSAFIYAKLTDTGRKLLAKGALTYDYWVFGDSEIDYGFDSDTNTLDTNSILVPKDKNPNIKYPISSVVSGTPFNTLASITPIQQVITNVAKTRGFFTGDTGTQLLKNKFKASGTTTTAILSGTTTLNIGIDYGLVNNGDIILLDIINSQQTVTTNSISTGCSVSLFYQIQNIDNANGQVKMILDRNLPNFTSDAGKTIKGFIFPSGDTINTFYGSGNTIAYWNNDALSFESNCNGSNGDVLVWNLSTVFTENLAGVDTVTYEGLDNFNSKKYAGIKEYLNYTSVNNNQKSIGVIHYSNNNISNNYGESFKAGTFKVSLPTVMWHKSSPVGGSGTSTQKGILLTAQVTTDTITSDSGLYNTTSIPFTIPFDYLIDNNGNIVGKVFYTLKFAVIEDEELIMALSYKSNRNWTLPTLSGTFSTSISENQGLLGTNEEAHVTYLLSNEIGAGYSSAIHCQNYTKVSRGGLGQNNIKINFPINQLPYLKSTNDGNGGFTATKLYMLVQKTLVGSRPSSTLWKKIDVSSYIQNYSGNGNINANDLEASSFTIDLTTYNSASNYVLDDVVNIPFISETNNLQFGDETFLFGNVDAQIQATAYKSSFIFSAPSSQFNNSVNPTYNLMSSHGVYISEVGIYNLQKQLVAIGKISNPINKKRGDTIQIQLDIDF